MYKEYTNKDDFGGSSWDTTQRHKEGKEQVTTEGPDDINRIMTSEYDIERERVCDLEELSYEAMNGKKR